MPYVHTCNVIFPLKQRENLSLTCSHCGLSDVPAPERIRVVQFPRNETTLIEWTAPPAGHNVDGYHLEICPSDSDINQR